MNDQLLTIASWPRAIIHVDADAFFASCEQAINPALKGKPVVTGKERGIVSAASYEAKARGITRAMRLFEAKKACPDLVTLPSDYETYSLFSVRIFDILRSFSPDVEEYSIDEAFVDLTGLRRTYHTSYGQIAEMIQERVERELDITVSIGVSITKVLAKIASKYKKPKGITMIPGKDIHTYLVDMPVGKVWGIGGNTTALLNKLGITSALEYARKDERFIKRHLSKPYLEIWHELNGRSVYPVAQEERADYKSISKVKTFTPPSDDEQFIYAQLSKNLENACIKARRYKLAATKLILLLRAQDFSNTGAELKLSRPSAHPAELFDPLRKGFKQVYNPTTRYRSTGVVLVGLVSAKSTQYSLFEDVLKIEKISKLYFAVDTIARKFGKHSVFHASSLPVRVQTQHEGARGDVAHRKRDLFRGENIRQRLELPLLRIKV
ncbi:MAG: DNA polymerase IV [Deltaproteobacteria bacterium]|nr:DNA polymerase IV [Deltaproteobacteria bacterium]